MGFAILASRSFDAGAQTAFAALTGDANPIHMDEVAARRTQAGARVVHGVHALLWLLDSLAAAHPDLPSVASLKVRFDRMLYVDDQAEARLAALDDKRARCEVACAGVVTMRVALVFGPTSASTPLPRAVPEAVPATARDLPIECLEGLSGCLAAPGTEAEFEAAFPAAAGLLGAARLRAIGATTLLVGMVCPGLHSIFGGLQLSLSALNGEPGLSWRVTAADRRFRVVRHAVGGNGIAGTVDCFARRPPTPQADMDALRSEVAPGEFAGVVALVVGGSRGLGELAAKLLAAGGAEVILTYVVGRADAEGVAREIRAGGGRASIMPYDVAAPVAGQFDDAAAVTHLLYMATPQIFRHKAELLVPSRLEMFMRFYVTGFWELMRHLHGLRPGLRAFYPSTVYVAQRPAGLGEYAMAKAAGEILCEEINAHLRPSSVVMARLPRLATDQTTELQETGKDDSVAVLLPLLREWVAGPGATRNDQA